MIYKYITHTQMHGDLILDIQILVVNFTSKNNYVSSYKLDSADHWLLSWGQKVE